MGSQSRPGRPSSRAEDRGRGPGAEEQQSGRGGVGEMAKGGGCEAVRVDAVAAVVGGAVVVLGGGAVVPSPRWEVARLMETARGAGRVAGLGGGAVSRRGWWRGPGGGGEPDGWSGRRGGAEWRRRWWSGVEEGVQRSGGVAGRARGWGGGRHAGSGGG